jgi:hypothetical protein
MGDKDERTVIEYMGNYDVERDIVDPTLVAFAAMPHSMRMVREILGRESDEEHRPTLLGPTPEQREEEEKAQRRKNARKHVTNW